MKSRPHIEVETTINCVIVFVVHQEYKTSQKVIFETKSTIIDIHKYI